MKPPARQETQGFSLLELLLVIILIAVLTTIVVAVYPNMTDTTKQSATISNLRTIASAMSMYHIDNNRYPEANDIFTLAEALEPEYIRRLPTVDGWGQNFLVDSQVDRYTIGSGGKEWNGNEPLNPNPEGATLSYDADIILTNGSFTQFPVNASSGR